MGNFEWVYIEKEFCLALGWKQLSNKYFLLREGVRMYFDGICARVTCTSLITKDEEHNKPMCFWGRKGIRFNHGVKLWEKTGP